MAEVDRPVVQDDERFHKYTGNTIPWYVHIIWILFWCFALYYMTTYLLPALKLEMVTPP